MVGKYVILMFMIFVEASLIACTNKPIQQNYNVHEGIGKNVQTGNSIDYDFLSTLSMAGVFAVAETIGLDTKTYLTPLATIAGNPYRRYRWSTGHYDNGALMISAMPPEEEMGWTPWERWYKDENGITKKESWVLYPLQNPTSSGIARWYKLDESDLAPRFLKKPSSLEELLRLSRVYDAATVLGFDAEQTLTRPLDSNARLYYEQCRWVVVPHILAADAPVIYILPPMDRSDEWPWESWYSDGKSPLIHHVHYTKRNPLTTAAWREYNGAPQRPPEIFGVNWFWYNDTSLKPTVTTLHEKQKTPSEK